jgi:hypothetical protein
MDLTVRQPGLLLGYFFGATGANGAVVDVPWCAHSGHASLRGELVGARLEPSGALEERKL